MIRISIEGQGGTLEEAAADLSKTAVAFIKRAQERQQPESEAPAPAGRRKPKPEPKNDWPLKERTEQAPADPRVEAPKQTPAPETPKQAPAEPVVSAKMVNQARDQAVAYAEAKGPKALQKLLAEFKIKRVSELARADYPRWVELTMLDRPDSTEGVVEGEDLLK